MKLLHADFKSASSVHQKLVVRATGRCSLNRWLLHVQQRKKYLCLLARVLRFYTFKFLYVDRKFGTVYQSRDNYVI